MGFYAALEVHLSKLFHIPFCQTFNMNTKAPYCVSSLGVAKQIVNWRKTKII